MIWPVGRLPTVPEYYKGLINNKVDLINEPKQCCPFHNEDTPSFSYMPERGVWSCFGACHAIGKDVIDMHQRFYKLKTREEAETSLRYFCQCPKVIPKKLVKQMVMVNEAETEHLSLIQEATILANTVERWLELDYVMSKYPVSTMELNDLLMKWKRG